MQSKPAAPPSQSIVTCSEKHKEDGRVPVAPLALPSMWEGTKYTVATRPSNWGEVGLELKRMKSLRSPLNLRA